MASLVLTSFSNIVQSEITGEVEKVLWKDGEPVGYGDPLIAIRPSFQGIKIKG
jgi:multidrug resistance efflux pump